MDKTVDNPSVLREVQAAVDRLFEVVAKADITATMALMADAPHADQGTLKTHQQLTEAYGVLYDTIDRIVFDRTCCDITLVTPEFAYVIAEGTFQSFGKDGSELGGQIAWTYLWTKTSDGWKLQHMHQSLQQNLPERLFARQQPDTQSL